MNNVCILSVLSAFFISAAVGPIVIPFLRRIKCGQTVREEGPSTHLKKTGTPTMGGLLILFSVAAAALFPALHMEEYSAALPVLFLTLGFGLIGFLDDYIKVVCRRSEGLSVLEKLAGQILVTGVFAYYLLHYTDVDLAMRVPFVEGRYLDFGVWNIPVLFFIVLGTVNGVNFTDGLDGLASSVTVIVAVYFTVVAIGLKSGLEPVTCAVVGALLGFLLFNVHPASVFMGDTGSLALGGFVAACAYMMQMPLYIAVVGSIYLIEVLSVIIQVVYFKASGGRRIFKMAPLHHHFELCGWSETRVVAVFTIITAILCLVGLIGIW